MTHSTPTIVVLGATGYTGRLIAESLARTGHPFLLAARNGDRLAALAAELDGPPTRVVDVQDPAALRELLRPGDAVINTVGPFTELGEPVVSACIDAGTHYLDTTGEQPWMHAIFQRHHDAARSAGVSIVNAMAFEYALGDCALALAADEADGSVRIADVIYAWGGAASSRGTRRTVVRMLGRRGFVLRDGELQRQVPGARHRTVELESGDRLHAVSFQSGEIVTAPRHLSVDTVRGWLVLGARTARLVPWFAAALPVVVPALRPLLEVLATRGSDPTVAQREASRFTIRVELATATGHTALEVHGTDPYGITAALAIRGARRALQPDAPRGVVAPARILQPSALLDSLSEYGIRLVRS